MVTNDQVRALRAFLLNDQDEYDRLIGMLEETESLTGYSALFGSAFFDAVNRRFSPTWTTSEIIRFVAKVRTRYVDDPSLLDPRQAEILIRTTLGDGSVDELDDEIRSAQMILLPVFIREERPNHLELEEILTQARRRANGLPL